MIQSQLLDDLEFKMKNIFCFLMTKISFRIDLYINANSERRSNLYSNNFLIVDLVKSVFNKYTTKSLNGQRNTKK